MRLHRWWFPGFAGQTPMSWNNSQWFRFNDYWIRLIVPTRPGVYAVANSDAWIYIGQSENVQARLTAHWRRVSVQSVCIWHWSPVAFSYETVDGADARRLRETQLVRKYQPRCNRNRVLV